MNNRDITRLEFEALKGIVETLLFRIRCLEEHFTLDQRIEAERKILREDFGP